MKKLFVFAAAVFAFVVPALAVPETQSIPAVQTNPDAISQAARGVIYRTFPEMDPALLRMEILPKQNGLDVFETESAGGILTVRGSSATAICRGFYDFLKTNHLGMISWENKDFRLRGNVPDTAKRRVVSPVRHHYYLNVVTFGYSAPYWSWERWEREIDRMALLGIDMPLAPNATEAIAVRVWGKLGLTPEEIDAFYTAPAHLPWQRMGNIANHDGKLSAAWHRGQISLQHAILARMKSLGMKPICPAFGGFVPAGLKRIFPQAKIRPQGWKGWEPEKCSYFLAPDDPLFRKIGRLFLCEWQKEFGKQTYFLADSFNEMELPAEAGDPAVRNALLSTLGRQVYGAISDVAPDAVWVMQGWMFGYQREIWNAGTLRALLEKVPADKVLLLDLAADYNHCFWHNGMNREYFDGFLGKPWIFSVVPNMGGKCAMTGELDFYARGLAAALNSPQRGNLVGAGCAPEGIENNDVLHELIYDAAWSNEAIPPDRWTENYCRARYGAFPPAIREAWDLFRRTAYAKLVDHPRFNWQLAPGTRKSTAETSREFARALKIFVEAKGAENSPLFRQDAIEAAAIFLGIRMHEAIRNALDALDGKKPEEVKIHLARFRKAALQADALLENHPTWRLCRWIDFARKRGSTAAEKDAYEANARRLVTVWGPPVDDYSARIWSGLIRDYYLPRQEYFFTAKLRGENPNMRAWEERWIRSRGFSPCTKPQDALAACRAAVK